MTIRDRSGKKHLFAYMRRLLSARWRSAAWQHPDAVSSAYRALSGLSEAWIRTVRRGGRSFRTQCEGGGFMIINRGSGVRSVADRPFYYLDMAGYFDRRSRQGKPE